MSAATVLIADDDKAICTVLEQAMRRQGYDVMVTDSGKKLMHWVEGGKGDVVVTDVLMPETNGLDVLERIKAMKPSLPVIVISAQNTLMTAVQASQRGAYEYMPKPFDLDLLVECIGKAIERRPENTSRKAADDARPGDTPIIGRSPAMQEIYRTLARMVKVNLTVMIMGESGTGKELIARALHVLGPRKEKNFIALNMAAIPRDLVESELFGHEKGAFTGATSRKSGAFEQAEDGTLFLDEIGDMPIEAQTRLLRVLQQGEYTAVGGTRAQTTNARIITATHQDLARLVRQGAFREDLYYRLNVVPIKAPALRERRDDIAELVQHFLAKASSKGLPSKEISPGALDILKSHSWPGNVRELENIIYRLATLHPQRTIDETAVRAELAVRRHAPLRGDERPLCDLVREHVTAYFRDHEGSLPLPGVYDRLLPLVEKPLIEVTLKATQGNQIRAAEILGINRNTLRKKILALEIDLAQWATRK